METKIDPFVHHLLINGAINTDKEIKGQPELWLKVYSQIINIQKNLAFFLNNIYRKQNLQIILTGAGTSAYIGEVLEGPFQNRTGISTRAISSTDLVTHPELYIKKSDPTLLVSFARSGDSPESTKVIELVEKISQEVYHLVITCNPKSNLIDSINDKKHFTILMPPEANDKSLAMTGSFTSMLLVGLLITRINFLSNAEDQIVYMSKYGKKILSEYAEDLKIIAKKKFSRAVFLGSGLLKGIAQEAHLKLQELTDGKVICQYDSFLGFRHGPKVVLNNETLIMYIFSNNDYVKKYEQDLVLSVKNSQRVMFAIGVAEHKILGVDLDLEILLSEDLKIVDEDLYSVVSILPAQLLGYYKSINLGLKPDSPSESEIITRVVKGVKLYTYNK
jgi:tagatose-6-phosphate ketose/aldose isomerase